MSNLATRGRRFTEVLRTLYTEATRRPIKLPVDEIEIHP